MEYIATHKRTGNTIRIDESQKGTYETHPSMRGAYSFVAIEETKPVMSLDEVEDVPKAKKRRKTKPI